MAHLLSSRSLSRSGFFYGRFGGRISGKTARFALALLLLPAAAAALHGTIVDAEMGAPLALVARLALACASGGRLKLHCGCFHVWSCGGTVARQRQPMGRTSVAADGRTSPPHRQSDHARTYARARKHSTPARLRVALAHNVPTGQIGSVGMLCESV